MPTKKTDCIISAFPKYIINIIYVGSYINKIIQRELGQTETLVSRISKSKLTWFEHVVRMEDKRLPAKAIYCYVNGKRSRRQRHGWTT